MLKPAAFLAAAIVLASCTSMPGKPVPRGIAAYEGDPRLGEPANSICFASTIDGFSANKDRTVILRDGRKEYLVEVLGACPELEFAQAIGIDARTSCLTRSDALIVSSSLMGQTTTVGPNRCLIKDIYTWNSKAEAKEDAEAAPAE
ncbi:MAG: hypothetical protein CVT79_05355 [Alphaproteobacteria bacterium HGW-Alphaproteobacteria-18]|nr:MAG: hypothetical protein CVT79_05355 [Alphaproteobacteria bacterium HGW-Alphaproteobacteria-18]